MKAQNSAKYVSAGGPAADAQVLQAKKRKMKRQFTDEEKIEAVRRVTEKGESKSAVCRELEVAESTLRGWRKNFLKICAKVAQDSRCTIDRPPKRRKKEHQIPQSDSEDNEVVNSSLAPRDFPMHRTPSPALQCEVPKIRKDIDLWTSPYSIYGAQNPSCISSAWTINDAMELLMYQFWLLQFYQVLYLDAAVHLETPVEQEHQEPLDLTLENRNNE